MALFALYALVRKTDIDRQLVLRCLINTREVKYQCVRFIVAF